MKEHNNAGSFPWRVGRNALLLPKNASDYKQEWANNTMVNDRSKQKQTMPIDLT